MGYESKIYLVRKSNFFDEDGKRFAEKIAEFNLSKVYGVSSILRAMPKTDCYIYADDGDTEMLEDRYGDELTECTPEKLIELIEDQANKFDTYWRYNLILPCLREIAKLKDDKIYCLHFGY